MKNQSIEKRNTKSMMQLLHGEMKRIQSLKCPADVDMVKEHTEALKEMDRRTIRIEASAYTTIALITIFGVVVGLIIWADKNKIEKQSQAEKTKEPVHIVSYNGIEAKGKDQP